MNTTANPLAPRPVAICRTAQLWGCPEQGEAICLTLSHRGMVLVAPTPIPEGTLLRTTIELPGAGEFGANAVVVSTRETLGSRMVLRFLSLSPTALATLNQYLGVSARAA